MCFTLYKICKCDIKIPMISVVEKAPSGSLPIFVMEENVLLISFTYRLIKIKRQHLFPKFICHPS